MISYGYRQFFSFNGAIFPLLLVQRNLGRIAHSQLFNINVQIFESSGRMVVFRIQFN